MGWCQTAWAAGELYAVTVLSGTHVVCISLGPGAVLWTPERRGWYLWTLVISSPGKRARKKVPILSLAHTLPLHLSKGISYLYKHTVTEKALCYWPDFLEKMYTCIKFFPPLGKMFTKLNLRSIAFSSCWFLIFFFFSPLSSRSWFFCLVLSPFWLTCPFTGSLGTRLLLRILSATSLKYHSFSWGYFLLFYFWCQTHPVDKYM